MSDWRGYMPKNSSSNWRSYIYGEEEANKVMEERDKQHLEAQKAYQERAKRDEEERKKTPTPFSFNYKLPSYLQDTVINEVLEMSKKIKTPSTPISTFKGLDNNFNEKTYNIYGTQKVSLPTINNNNLDSYSRQFVADTIAKKDKWNLANASTKSDKKREEYIDKYFKNQEEFKKTYLTKEAKKDTKFTRFADKVSNTGAVKFLDRLGSEMADTATFKTGNYEKRDTGNKVANTITDILGMGLGMAVSPLGTPSLNKGLNTVGANVSNKVSTLLPKAKIPNIPVVNKLLPSALRGATEFGAFGGIESYSRGDNTKDIAKNIGKGALTGAAFGGALKGVGMALPKIKNSAIRTNSYESIMPLEQQNKLLGIKANKTLNIPKMSKDYSGKYKLVNTELNKAQKRYDEAIGEIQNYFKTNKLTNDEVARIKPKLGIDLPKLVSNLDNAKTNVNKIAEQTRLLRVAGINTKPLPQLPKLNNTSAKIELPKPLNTTTILPNIKDLKPKSQIVSSSKDKSSFTDSLSKFYTRLIDTNDPIKKVGDKTYTLATNSKNVGGTVDYILKNGLVDRNGNKIGSSLKEIAENVPKGQEKDFWEYVMQRHNVARATEGKPIYSDFTPQMSNEKAKYFESINPAWKDKADNITKFVDKFMNEWGVNSGITDKELYSSLRQKYPNYIPTNRDFSSLEQGMLSTNGKGFINQTGVIKKAKGSDRDITDPIENIMNLVNRTVRTAKYNEVGQSMVNTIIKNPDSFKGIAEIIPPSMEINSNVKNVVSVLVDGKPINVQINDKSLLDSLQKLSQSNVGDIEKAFKKATGVFKSLITQKNPVFAIRNIARDVPTAYINGSENNPIKYGLDLLKAGKDLAINSPIAQQYRGLGGGGSNFFNSDNVAKSAKELTKTPLLQRIGNGIEKFNNLTESAPRLAEFKRVANKTGDLQKGLFAANDVSTNFSRGGDITKHIDSFTPYLNASVQGLDKLARQFKNKPIATILKGATAITAPTLVLNHINKDNPNYQQLDDRTKDNYFLIPKEDGTFFKLPKARELGVLFGSLTERILRQNQGDEEAFKNFNTTIKTNFGPANPAENNILAPLLINLPKNKDFAKRTIVPQSMQDRSLQYQYDETTSEIGKKIGEIAKLSPKQVDYVIKSYTGVVGQLLLPGTTKNNKGGAAKAITTQFTADPLYSNQVLTDFYDNYDKYKNLAADKNFIEDIDSKVLTKEENIRNYLAKASKEISALNKQSRTVERAGDMEKVRELRQKMLDIASKANSTIK